MLLLLQILLFNVYYTVLKQITNDTISYLHHVVCLLPSPVVLVSQKIQREGQSARKVRHICEMKRYHGTAGGVSHWLNTRLPKEENLKKVSRTGQEKIMRGDMYKHEELKMKRKNWLYKKGEALLLTTTASSPKYTAISYLRQLTHRRPTVSASLPRGGAFGFHCGIIWVWFRKPLLCGNSFSAVLLNPRRVPDSGEHSS